MKSYYLNTKLYKMGKWALYPADSMCWHGYESSKYFREEFGFGKGTFVIHVFDGNQFFHHSYIPKAYFRQMKDYVYNLKKDDFKSYENKVKKFYELKKISKEGIEKLKVNNYSDISVEELVKMYRGNRDWVHRITIYDQFGWLGEEIFDEDIENILVNEVGLKKNSKEYHNVLFTLTKPEEISTTLEEKRATLGEAIKVKNKQSSIEKSSECLAKFYGWMPVFAYGTAWDSSHFESELRELVEKEPEELKLEFEKLRDYSKIRSEEIEHIIQKYNLSKEKLQVFVDFGLMLDARNEAEYVLSFAGFYLLPIYKEIARRLALSINQVRTLTEDEIVDSLVGKQDPYELLSHRHKVFAWGFDEDMKEITFFSTEDAEELFKYAEENSEGAGNKEDGKGICASVGKVSGVAKIVNSPDENSKVNSGDILITSATTVDYLPAMKKASAFVTEVGGLTCHAAVVAREFGVPCVVSLRDATVNFKDGDKVEVDADNGTVKII